MKKYIKLIALAAVLVFLATNISTGENPQWSKGKYSNWQQNAAAHWQKHGVEFPEFESADEYVQFANDFIKNPPAGTQTKTEKDGDTLFYSPEHNIFAVKSKQGVPRTMFKPNAGIDYWNKQ